MHALLYSPLRARPGARSCTCTCFLREDWIETGLLNDALFQALRRVISYPCRKLCASGPLSSRLPPDLSDVPLVTCSHWAVLFCELHWYDT
eukprot:IDg10028t1